MTYITPMPNPRSSPMTNYGINKFTKTALMCFIKSFFDKYIIVKCNKMLSDESRWQTHAGSTLSSSLKFRKFS